MKSFVRALALAFSGLFVLLLAIHTGATIVEGQSLERVLANLHAKGEPVALSEIAPPSVPDDRNAALVYQRAFSLYPSSNYDRSNSILSDFIGNKPASQRLANTEQVRSILAKAGPALDLVRQAAAMPACRFPVNYEAGLGALYPHLSPMRRTASLLSARSLVEALDGQSGQSLADIGTILDMSHQISGEPTLISQLVQYACLTIAEHALQRSLEAAPPDAEASADLYSKLAGYDVYDPFTRAMQGERCFGLWGFSAIERDPKEAASLFGPGESTEASGRAVSPALTSGLMTLAGPVLKKDEIYYLNAMQSVIDQVRERKPSTRLDLSKVSTDSIPRYAVITRALLPVLNRAIQKRDEAATRLGLAQWALTLNAIHERTGQYPASLSDAQRRTIAALPNDPFVEQPFHYVRQPGGYILYSVGPNGRDDGGVGAQDKQNPAADDITWRMAENRTQ